MNEHDPGMPEAERRNGLSRRRFLTVPPLIGIALTMAAVPARAEVRAVECLADLEVF